MWCANVLRTRMNRASFVLVPFEAKYCSYGWAESLNGFGVLTKKELLPCLEHELSIGAILKEPGFCLISN